MLMSKVKVKTERKEKKRKGKKWNGKRYKWKAGDA